MNCLEHCLSQWLYLPDFRIWYNSGHVVIIESEIDLHDKGYLPAEDFGLDYFVGAFEPSGFYEMILRRYFDATLKSNEGQ